VPTHKKNQQTVPEPELKPFDLRYLRGLPQRFSCHESWQLPTF
jgi:hypothetical protein